MTAATTTRRHAAPNAPATLPQRETLVNLYAQYNPLVADDLAHRGPAANYGPRDAAFTDMVEEIRNASHVPADFASYTRQAASNMIGNLIASIRKLERAARERTAPTPSTTALTPGLYADTADGDGDPSGWTVYEVKASRSGNLYACRLDPTGASKATRWIYEGAKPLRTLTLTALTEDMARVFGVEHVICCRCGADLTNETSKALGIGPICRSYF